MRCGGYSQAALLIAWELSFTALKRDITVTLYGMYLYLSAAYATTYLLVYTCIEAGLYIYSRRSGLVPLMYTHINF